MIAGIATANGIYTFTVLGADSANVKIPQTKSIVVGRGVAGVVPVVEFYNTPLDNYFITADPVEAAAIDNGSAGPGWARTGAEFNFKSGGDTSVCRFYGSLSPGPNSHFYTVNGSECGGLKVLQVTTPVTSPRWNFESYDFLSTPPVNGACPAGRVPVYRAYNNAMANVSGRLPLSTSYTRFLCPM